MEFKTKPFDHQLRCWDMSKDRTYFALFMEMGTGKTKVAIDTIAWLYLNGKIDSAVVVAPKGVYQNWVRREFARHMPDDVKYTIGFYDALGSAKLKVGGEEIEVTTRSRDSLLELQDAVRAKRGLRIYCINDESIATKQGFYMTSRFLLTGPSLMTVDESTRIKNPKAIRSKAAYKLGHGAEYRRILCGDPYANSPLDVFGQCHFLKPGAIGYTSAVTFRSRFANLESMLIMNGMRSLDKSSKESLINLCEQFEPNKDFTDWEFADLKTFIERAAYRTGRGKVFKKVNGYRDLEELRRLVEPFSFTVKKKDCLDLPPKIYMPPRDVQMTKDQAKAYEEMRQTCFANVGDGTASAAIVLTQFMRLQQITAGFVKRDDGEEYDLVEPEKNPRILGLLEALEEVGGKAVVWSCFSRPIRQIAAMLAKIYGPESVVIYDGTVSDEQCEYAKTAFQDVESPVRWFVGNQMKGALGNDLFAAEFVFYYAQNFNNELRVQSEDRAHRIGLTHPVAYQDLRCPGTCDDKVIDNLSDKKGISEFMRDQSWRTLFD